MTEERKVEVTVEDTPEPEPDVKVEVDVEESDEVPATTEEMQDQQTG